MRELLRVDEDKLKSEIEQVKEHLAQFGDDLPAEVSAQLEKLEARLD
jgi:phosphoenolpyruvate carboxykinase (GTP)